MNKKTYCLCKICFQEIFVIFKWRFLPCLFASLVHKYELGPCDDINSNKKYWKWASGNKATERVKIFAKYFHELSTLVPSLDDCSICVRYYNHIVTFLKNSKQKTTLSLVLQEKTNESDLNNNCWWRPRCENYRGTGRMLYKSFVRLEKTKYQLKQSEVQRIRYVNIIWEYQRRINELELRIQYQCLKIKNWSSWTIHLMLQQ